MAHPVKDLTLSMLWLGSLLGTGSIPGLGISSCSEGSQKKKVQFVDSFKLHKIAFQYLKSIVQKYHSFQAEGTEVYLGSLFAYVCLSNQANTIKIHRNQ